MTVRPAPVAFIRRADSRSATRSAGRGDANRSTTANTRARPSSSNGRARTFRPLPCWHYNRPAETDLPMQIIRNRKVFDVCIIGSGAGGGMAAKVLTEAGADVLMLEAGPMWDPVKDSKMFAWNYDSPRRGAAIPERHVRRVRRRARRLDARRRAVHERAGQQLRLVPLADARRPHQPLGPHLAALRPGRLPPQEPRRPRRRLADHLRRHQAVLRRGRQAGRHLRHQSRAALPQRAGRHLPAAAAAALLRAA